MTSSVKSATSVNLTDVFRQWQLLASVKSERLKYLTDALYSQPINRPLPIHFARAEDGGREGGVVD